MARDAKEILKECGAFLEGHFLLSSGRHSGAYCQMAYLQQYPDKCAEVMAPVAEKLKEMDVDLFVGPAMGGIVYAYELGRQCGKPAIFTERVDNVMTLKRFQIKPGMRWHHRRGRGHHRRFQPGDQARHRRSGGHLPGHRLRGGPHHRRRSLSHSHPGQRLKLELPNYAPDECPICKEGKLPLVHLGSRKMQERQSRSCDF